MFTLNAAHAQGDYDVEKAKEKIFEVIDRAENELKSLVLAAKLHAPQTDRHATGIDKKLQVNNMLLRLADDELRVVSERKTKKKKKKNKMSHSGKSRKSGGKGKKERKEKKEKKSRKTSSEEKKKVVQRTRSARVAKRTLHDAKFIELTNGGYRLFFDVPTPADRLEQQHQVMVDFRHDCRVRVRIDGVVYR